MEKKEATFIASSKEHLDIAWNYYDSLPEDLKSVISAVRIYDMPIGGNPYLYIKINVENDYSTIKIPAKGHTFESAGTDCEWIFITFDVGGIIVVYRTKFSAKEQDVFFVMERTNFEEDENGNNADGKES